MHVEPEVSRRIDPNAEHGTAPRVSAARTAGIALFLLTALNLFNFIDRYILPGVQPLVQKEFGVNDAQIGLLTTAFFFTYMLVAPLTGWLGDRFPRKPLIIAGALLWSAATLYTAWVHSYETLLIRHAVVGIGEATFSIFAPALLADFYPERDRNRILSIFYATIPVGGALGYLTGGVLGQHYGWRMPFFIAALPGVLIALGFWLFVREPKRGSADSLAPTLDRATLHGLANNPGFWCATLGLAMWTFAVGGISTFLPTYFVRFAHMSIAKAGTVTGALTVVDGLLGTIVGGWLGQIWLRRNSRALYLISAWGSVLAIPAAALVFFGSQRVFLPAAFVAEFFLFLNTGPLNTAIVNSVAAPIRATAISVNLFVIHALGDAFSPTLIGKLSDATNLRVGLSITLVTLALSGIILFAGARYAPLLNKGKLQDVEGTIPHSSKSGLSG
jgi:MFS family permease